MTSQLSTTSLTFPLDVDDGWPPVAVECMPFGFDEEYFVALKAPLFVKNLSVGDKISAKVDNYGKVLDWTHKSTSPRSTIWLLGISKDSHLEILVRLQEFRNMGCDTVSCDELGIHSVDVPSEVSMQDVDSILDQFDPKNVAVAFPSMRHTDE